MADRSLVERKLDVSKKLTKRLTDAGAPLLAAYWELAPDKDRWSLYLVPKSAEDERKLVDAAGKIMVTEPYRLAFSLSDVFVDAHQVARARAIASYIRSRDNLERQFDTTFTGGQYFESVIVLYVAPELLRKHHAA